MSELYVRTKFWQIVLSTGFCATLSFLFASQAFAYMVLGAIMPLKPMLGFGAVSTLVVGTVFALVHRRGYFTLASCIVTGAGIVGSIAAICFLCGALLHVTVVGIVVFVLYSVAVGVGGYFGAPRALSH